MRKKSAQLTEKPLKAKVYRIGMFDDGPKKYSIALPNGFPKEALKVDDWFSPAPGELCLNDKGHIDVVKKITWNSGDIHLKPHRVYHFEKSRIKYGGSVIRLEVKKRKTYIHNGKVFVHREALDGGYIDQIAQEGKVTEYEYRQYE